MAEKTVYRFRVAPQEVDFTLRATIPSLTGEVLNTAGVDAEQKGFGVDALNRDNYSWVLSRMALEVDARPRQYTEYEITTWVNEYGRVLSTRNFTLRDAREGEFGRAVTQWCMIDLRTRSAVDLAAIGTAHGGALVDAPCPMEKPRKVRRVEPTLTAEHRVVYSDIDFNSHVNTMRYIAMMFDLLPVERAAADRPTRMDIHFLHECRYGQVLGIGCELRDDQALFEIACDQAVAVRASLAWR